MPQALTTTAKAIFGPTNIPCSFEIHATLANTTNINLSGIDPNAVTDIEELQPGQTITFEDFTGTVFAVAASGTPTYNIPFVKYGRGNITK